MASSQQLRLPTQVGSVEWGELREVCPNSGRSNAGGGEGGRSIAYRWAVATSWGSFRRWSHPSPGAGRRAIWGGTPLRVGDGGRTWYGCCREWYGAVLGAAAGTRSTTSGPNPLLLLWGWDGGILRWCGVVGGVRCGGPGGSGVLAQSLPSPESAAPTAPVLCMGVGVLRQSCILLLASPRIRDSRRF